MLPDGSAAVVTVWPPGMVTATQIGVITLAAGELEILFEGSFARYSRTGHLVYWRDGGLWAVSFDARRRQLLGPAAPVVEGVGASLRGLPYFALSSVSGTLAYRPPGGIHNVRSLVWVDRDGRAEPVGAPPRAYVEPRISPDGNLVAVSSLEDGGDIWIYDLARGTEQLLTLDPAVDGSPVWTTDGSRVIFRSVGRDGRPGIFWKAADGTGEAERLSTGAHLPGTAMPDGTHVLYTDTTEQVDIGWLSLEGEREPQLLIDTPLEGEGNPAVSPDGRWMAYVGVTDGEFEVYVRSFPDVDSRWLISRGGGTQPVWGRDGKDLFYRSGSQVMRVTVGDGPPTTWASPSVLFEGPYVSTLTNINYDVASDGRFLMLSDVATASDPLSANVVVVEHWSTELNELVPPAN